PGTPCRDVAQRRFAQDQEQKERDRAEKEVAAEPAVVVEEADHESDQRHQESGDRPDVRELVLEVMPGEELAEPVLAPPVAMMARRCRRRSGGRQAGDRLRLRLATEAAEVGACLNGLAARAAEHRS